jgi:hypothetical protein
MSIKKIVWLAIFVLAFMPGCHRTSNNTLLQQKGKAQTAVLQLLQTIDSMENLGDDLDLVKEYIAKAEEFGDTYPEDIMSAEFLYKAGLMAMTVAKASDDLEEIAFFSQKALLIFNDIQLIYPDFNGVGNCIINKGIVYEDILHDYENAEVSYREFIARYPTDTLAINLESYLPYLGKSPEEILASFGK